MTIIKAVTITVGVFVVALFLLTRLDQFPRSALIIIWPVLIVFLGGPRLLYRLLKDGNLQQAFVRVDVDSVPVVLAGAGDAADLFLRSLARQKNAPYRVEGIVARDPKRLGGELRGARILGLTSELPDVVAQLAKRGRMPEKLIIAEESYDGENVRALVDMTDKLGMGLGRLPQLTELRAGADTGKALDVRPIDVADLLGRPQKVLDRIAMALLVKGKRVLVTGAGGTIGSELTRQIAAIGPSIIFVLDNSEFNLYQIDMELAEKFPDLPRVALMANVRDKQRVRDIFKNHKPEIICHAAALKHVPLSEANPHEAILTNVGGTRNIADAALEFKVDCMVMVSTDKAVNPTNVMGASKRSAERYVQALSVANPEGPHFVAVRFGNVLGSSGSVVPLFQRQLEDGGPLTVTHKDVTRFFMTVKEAVELILQAAALPRAQSQGGRLFVLEMGEPVRISDLAHRMIKLAGLVPGKDVEVVYTGLRPAEKLYEELFLDKESFVPTHADGIQLATPEVVPLQELIQPLDLLLDLAGNGDAQSLMSQLKVIVPEFDHNRDN
jgi:FlaA1/EpsC-like NDP-sugar epimerase